MGMLKAFLLVLPAEVERALGLWHVRKKTHSQTRRCVCFASDRFLNEEMCTLKLRTTFICFFL